MNRLPENGFLFTVRDVPLHMNEEGLARILCAAGIPITVNRVSIKRYPDGTASALVSLGKQFVAGLVNSHMKANGKDLRMIVFDSQPRKARKQIQNLPPLTPEAA